MKSFNIYFTRAFGTQYHFINSLKRYYIQQGLEVFVIVSHPDPSSLSLQAADLSLIEPHFDSTKNIDFFKKVCVDFAVNCIIPGESSLITVLQNEEFFLSHHIRIMSCTNKGTLEVLRSKSGTYKHLSTTALNSFIPNYYYVTSVAEFRLAYASLSRIGLDVCFKPDISQGGLGFRIVDNRLKSFFDFFGYSVNRNVYQYFDDMLSSVKNFPPLIVCQYLSGIEYTLDCIGYEDELFFCGIRKKSNNVRSVCDNLILQDFAGQVQKLFQFSFQYNIQVRFDGEQFYLLEINPRYAAGSYIYELEGYNLLGRCVDKLLFDKPFSRIKASPMKYVSADSYIKMVKKIGD